MSDYSFMRSGLVGEYRTEQGARLETMRKVMSLVRVMMEEAIKSAALFVATCGRKEITMLDSIMALQYEAHTFFKKNIDMRFISVLNEEREHTYLTDDTESESSEEETDSSEEEYTTELAPGLTPTANAFHDRVLKYHAEWQDWHPTDLMQRLVKDSINKATLL